jgi:hypothetical protein
MRAPRIASIATIGLAATFAAAALAGVAAATANDKVDLQQDCGSPCVEPVDSAGPTGFGFVNYNKNAAGDLRVVAVLKNAAPDTTYTVFFVCGPTHATACGFVSIGTVTTNGQGNGSSGAIVLTSPPYVGGPDDHVDLIKDNGDLNAGVYLSTPIVNV